MPDKRPLAHPLKRWQFYAACLRHATTGAWGTVGNVSTVLAFAPQLLKTWWPQGHAAAAALLKSFGFGEDLLWKFPLWIGGAILLVRLLTASFVIYQDKPSLDTATGTLRNKALRLSKEIGLFVTMREANQPPPGRLFLYSEEDTVKWANTLGQREDHSRATGQLYYELFAARVLDIREEFAKVGIVDDKLDAVYLVNPALNDGIATIVEQLHVMADRLPPDVLPSHELAFEHLRDENARLQKGVDALSPRHLRPEQSEIITKVMRAVLIDESKTWPPNAKKLIIAVCSIGTDADTIDYRDGIAGALEAAGFSSSRQAFIAGRPECDDFKQGVTIIDDRQHPDNPYHKAFVSALREAGIKTKAAEYPPPPGVGLAVDTFDLYYAVVTVIVGQRE